MNEFHFAIIRVPIWTIGRLNEAKRLEMNKHYKKASRFTPVYARTYVIGTLELRNSHLSNTCSHSLT